MLLYAGLKGGSLLVNFCLYDESTDKTKKDFFQEMVKEVLRWGLRPRLVTGDNWYASTANFKFLRNQELSFLLGLDKNRIISTLPGQYQQVSSVTIPFEGLLTHLKEFDFVKVFQTVDREDNVRYYAYYCPDRQELALTGQAEFERAHHDHWQVEVFHHTVKQVCNLERFLVRTDSAIRTHVFGALRAFVRLTAFVHARIIDTFYSLHRQLFLQAQQEFIIRYA